jgi:hypothetical protein
MNNTSNSRLMFSPNKLNTRSPLKGNASFGIINDNNKSMNKKANPYDNFQSNTEIPGQFSSKFYNPFA